MLCWNSEQKPYICDVQLNRIETTSQGVKWTTQTLKSSKKPQGLYVEEWFGTQAGNQEQADKTRGTRLRWETSHTENTNTEKRLQHLLQRTKRNWQSWKGAQKLNTPVERRQWDRCNKSGTGQAITVVGNTRWQEVGIWHGRIKRERT